MRHSERASFNNCPRKWAYEQEELHKIVDGEESNDRNWGNAGHGALEVWYLSGSLPFALATFERMYPENQKEDSVKSLVNGLECIRQYVEHYKRQDDMWRVLGTEVSDEVEIDGDTHGLHIDLIAENTQGGGVYFWDHKFTEKVLGRGFANKYDLDAQMTRYTEYVTQKYGQCSGAIVNAISVRTLLRKNKFGEGPGLVCSFERFILNRTRDQVVYWKKSEQAWMKMMEYAQTLDFLPHHFGALCGWCEYKELCIAAGDEQIRELLYEKRRIYQ